MIRRFVTSSTGAGAIAVVVIVAAIYAAFIHQYPWHHGYEVKAVFTSAASQVDTKSPVRIAGVDVGKVKSVERGPGTSVVVTMEIDKSGRPLHRDATAKIRPRLFLEGSFFIDLQPGTPQSPELKSGGDIPLAQTDIPVQLDQVLTAFDAPTREQLQNVLHEYASALKKGSADAFRKGLPYWAPAFSGSAQTLEDVRGTDGDDLGQFIEKQSRVSEALADRQDDLANLITNFDTTVTALSDHRGDLGATLSAAASTLTRARPALQEIDAALPAVRSFAVAARPALRAAPKTLDLAQPVLHEASRLLDPSVLPAFLDQARPLARNATALAPPLDDLLGEVDTVVGCVRDKALPVLTSKLDDGKLSTGQPVWQELLHFPVGLASAGSNFDANGNWIRYNAGGGENAVATTLPGLGDILSLVPNVPLGARPRYVRGQNPPFKPDAACEDQKVPDLHAEAVPPPSSTKIEPLSGLHLDDLLNVLIPRERAEKKALR